MICYNKIKLNKGLLKISQLSQKQMKINVNKAMIGVTNMPA